MSAGPPTSSRTRATRASPSSAAGVFFGAPGKEHATIFDFLAMADRRIVVEDATAHFLHNELARNSLYRESSVKLLLPWLKHCHIKHLAG